MVFPTFPLVWREARAWGYPNARVCDPCFRISFYRLSVYMSLFPLARASRHAWGYRQGQTPNVERLSFYGLQQPIYSLWRIW